MSYKVTLQVKNLDFISDGSIRLSEVTVKNIEYIEQIDYAYSLSKQTITINKSPVTNTAVRLMNLSEGDHYACISDFNIEIKKGHTLKVLSFDYDCNTISFGNKTTAKTVTLCRSLFTTEYFKRI